MAPTPKKNDGEAKKIKKVTPKTVTKTKSKRQYKLVPGNIRYGRKKKALIKRLTKRNSISGLKVGFIYLYSFISID